MLKSPHKTLNPTPERRHAWILPRGKQVLQSRQGAALALALVVFIACLLGIFSRPANFLALVWPANGIMLGFLLRVQASATPTGWFYGMLAFVAADLLTGASLFMAIILNFANLAGISTGYVIYRHLPDSIVRLEHPQSVLYLLVAAAASGITAGLIGSFAHLLLFSGSPLKGWILWSVTEFINYITLLPALLSMPSWAALLGERRRFCLPSWRTLLPVAALGVSFIAAALIGGLGAIVFPLPALLWCALSYPVFPTALIALLSGIWSQVHVTLVLSPTGGSDEMILASVKLGVSLLGLAPVALAIAMQNRNT